MIRRVLMCVVAVSLAAAGCRGAKGGNGGPGPDGSPGPTATPFAGSPRIDRITPEIGSKRSLVFVYGTSFGATIAENEVRFGGLAGDVVSASPTELHVKPPVGLAFGDAPITVIAHSQTTAPIAFRYAPSGTPVPSSVAAPTNPGAGVALNDGRILIPDAAGAILVLATNGETSLLVSDPELRGARRLVQAPSGRVFVFATQSEGIFSVDPADGSLFVEHWGTAYRSGTFDAVGNLYAVPASAARVDKFDLTGAVTTGYATFAPTTVVEDVQILDPVIYAAVSAPAAGVQSASFATAGNVFAPLTTTGVTDVHCLAADGVQLLAGGVFTIAGAQEGVVHVDNAGTITAVTTDAAGQGRYQRVNGAIKLQSGDLLVSDAAGSVLELAGTALTVRAGAVGRAHSALATATDSVLSAVYNSSNFIPGWIVETFTDGRTHVRAQGIFGQMIPGDDATHVTVVRRDAVDVASIDLSSGAAATVFAVTAEMSVPVGLARDANGSYYVSSPSENVLAQYSSNGSLVDATFGATPVSAPENLLADGPTLFVMQPSLSEARKITISNGTVNDWLHASVGVGAPTSVFRDPDDSNLRLYVTDPSANKIWLIDAGGFVSPFGVDVTGARAVAQRADGTLVVTGDAGPQLLTP